MRRLQLSAMQGHTVLCINNNRPPFYLSASSSRLVEVNENICFRQVSVTDYWMWLTQTIKELQDIRCSLPFSGSEPPQARFSCHTSAHFSTRLWCTGVLVGWGRRQEGVGERWHTWGKSYNTNQDWRSERKQHGAEGPKVGPGSWKGGEGEQETHEEWVTRREDEGRKDGEGGGCFLSPFLPAHIDMQRERRRILGRMTFSLGPLLFLHAEWCASSLPSPSLPALPPFPCPSKLRHVISHHKNRGGKTRWRYRCLRVSGTKAACKYSRERRRSRGRRRAREDRRHGRRR